MKREVTTYTSEQEEMNCFQTGNVDIPIDYLPFGTNLELHFSKDGFEFIYEEVTRHPVLRSDLKNG